MSTSSICLCECTGGVVNSIGCVANDDTLRRAALAPHCVWGCAECLSNLKLLQY